MSRVFLPAPRTRALGWRQLVLAAILLGLLPVSWWLFGSRVEVNPAIGIITERRFLGRVTRRTVDVDQDGRIDGLYEFRWSDPADRPGSQPFRFEEDRDRDGRMDVWVTDLGVNPAGERELLFEVDTERDGEPDWSFKTLDSLSAYQAILERRGW